MNNKERAREMLNLCIRMSELQMDMIAVFTNDLAVRAVGIVEDMYKELDEFNRSLAGDAPWTWEDLCVVMELSKTIRQQKAKGGEDQ